MKRKFTVLKAASVMLIAIITGSSCQKQALHPEEGVSVLTDKSASGSIGMHYDIFTSHNEKAGRMEVIESRQYVQVSVYLDTRMAETPETLSALIVDSKGQRLAALEKFYIGGDPESDFSKKYTSKTFPLRNLQTGERIYYDAFIQKGLGYSIVIYDRGTVIARGPMN